MSVHEMRSGVGLREPLSKPRRACILGNGPAGLLAAQAAMMKGYDVEILSTQTRPSSISGAQYLDRPIPGITNNEPDANVRFLKKGSKEGYAEKIYNAKHAHTSWEKYHERKYPMWYMDVAYDKLWDEFFDRMNSYRVDANTMASLHDVGYDLIVSTIPLKAICCRPDEHAFTYQQVTIVPGLPMKLGKRYDQGLLRHSAEPWIMYNGKRKQSWYRACSFGEEQWTEYPNNTVDVTGGILIQKPLRSNCNCWLPTGGRLILAGRYGAWQKDQLASSAYMAVMDHAV